jgi:hypothetical protein
MQKYITQDPRKVKCKSICYAKAAFSDRSKPLNRDTDSLTSQLQQTINQSEYIRLTHTVPHTSL